MREAVCKKPLFEVRGLRHSCCVKLKEPGSGILERESAPKKDGKASEDLAGAAGTAAGKSVWMGTAVGIGSAAIVAALLYARRKK